MEFLQRIARKCVAMSISDAPAQRISWELLFLGYSYRSVERCEVGVRVERSGLLRSDGVRSHLNASVPSFHRYLLMWAR
jgi:hypothetical protein